MTVHQAAQRVTQRQAKHQVEKPAKIRWAARLPPRLLERLYEADAKGLRDIELCEDVGLRLHARCGTFVLVSRNEVECPSCGRVFTVATSGTSHCSGESCSWFTTRREYAQSLRNHYAHTGRATEAFARFHDRYPKARSYQAKILLIDALVHSFHVDEARQRPVKSVASKLLEGNKTEVVRFLDRLSAIDPAEKSRWRRTASQTIHGRIVSSQGDE